MPAAPLADLPMSNFEKTFQDHLKAGYQFLYIQSSEEARVESEIGRVAKRMGVPVTHWDIFEGFDNDAIPKDDKHKNPVHALSLMADENAFKSGSSKKNIVIFRDLDDFLTDPHVRRRIRSLAEGNRLVNPKASRWIVIISPVLNIPQKLKSCITVLNFDLPDEVALRRQINFLKESISDPKKRAALNEDLEVTLAANMLGLTLMEAENCLSRCIVQHDGFSPNMLSTIKEEKASIIRKSEVLTYIPENAIQRREDIGGFENYMEWLDVRRLAYSPAAQAENIDFPRGVALIGVPGTGKSIAGKATCLVLGLPGYILDIGSLFGSMVGESEQRTRDVLRQIDAQRGCVLMIDEADKALGNAHNSSGDSGVTKRVFGTILSWLAENKSRTFVIMTLNRTDGLPPELTRAGRFDAMFYTDMPYPAQRRQIMEIHMRRRHVDLTKLKLTDGDWSELTKATENFVGSELEEVIRSARYKSFAERQTGVPSFEDLLETAQIVSKTILYERDKDGINAIQAFCKGKAIPVCKPPITDRASRERQPRGIGLN